MSENHEAQALARWLEEHPGQVPPPDVDPEVIEALYALRPDLAPAPTLRIDDIFASIETGPFHTEEEVTESVVSLADERAKRVPHEVAPASQPPVAKRRVPWWAVPGAGALAAAALALVVVLPTAGLLLTQKRADLEAAAPAQSADAVSTPSSPAAAAAPAREVAEQAPADAVTRQRTDDDRQEKKKADGAIGGVGVDETVMGLEAPAEPAKPASVARGSAERDAESAPTESFDDRALEKSAAAKAEETAPAKELGAYGASAGASTSALAEDRAKDDKRAPAPSAAAAAEAEAPGDDGPAPYGGISSSSTDAALTAATDDSDDRKAMTAAWFLADRQHGRGDADAAMATIAKGLRRAGNEDLRSELMALQWTVAQSASPAVLDAAPATDQ